VIIPVKEPGNGKTRLAGVLDAAARARLMGEMLERVVAAARGARAIDEICLLGPAVFRSAARLTRLADPGGGLNAALTSALARCDDAARLVILHADLPRLTAADVERLAAAPADTIAIAPDRHGTGTNALSLPLPAAAGFAFAFGIGSFARHGAEIQRLGLRRAVIASPGLARDIDVPDDLPDAADCLEEEVTFLKKSNQKTFDFRGV
jgi:2-phospho-L-lactate guanylyltransferase